VRRILVTGGCGFIGSHFVRRLLQRHDDIEVVNLDALTYAGNPANLADIADDERYRFVHGSICDADAVARAADGCEAIVNFAAETHVDRSIMEAGDFIQTDVFGTYLLLEWIRDRGGRLLHVSTDEVYGDIDEGTATEASPVAPSSPYAASKAGGDMLVSAFARTYGADALIVRASNNYGPRQHPEKLIPLCILNALAGDELPVYGDGAQVRNWLYVEDCCSAIGAVLESGEAGQAYNVGGPDEMANIDVVKRILELTGRDESLISYVKDRPGHDRRYSLSSDRLESLGWNAAVPFDEGIARTVEWYRDNEEWWGPIRSGEYREYYERHYGKALG
jgi:dTDP-glucose 4,6-dehydratase